MLVYLLYTFIRKKTLSSHSLFQYPQNYPTLFYPINNNIMLYHLCLACWIRFVNSFMHKSSTTLKFSSFHALAFPLPFLGFFPHILTFLYASSISISFSRPLVSPFLECRFLIKAATLSLMQCSSSGLAGSSRN